MERYYTDDGQYRDWMNEMTGAKFFLNQYGDMSVGYQPLTADENGTITWRYFTEDEGDADTFRDYPTYGHLLTGYQTINSVSVYFSENLSENGKLYTDILTPNGRIADFVGIIR